MVEPITIGLSRESWGPRFWKILHTFAECSGSYTNTILQNDEADAWNILLKAQQFVMPCILCKGHYANWIVAHKFSKLRAIVGEERRAFLRSWVWGCHNAVNITNEKPSPDLDTMPVLYPKQGIEKEIKELYSMFQLGLDKRQLKLEDIHRWKTVVARLRSMYSI
jgi:hypothetical protein